MTLAATLLTVRIKKQAKAQEDFLSQSHFIWIQILIHKPLS